MICHKCEKQIDKRNVWFHKDENNYHQKCYPKDLGRGVIHYIGNGKNKRRYPLPPGHLHGDFLIINTSKENL